MANYSKFCIICGEEFITGKISTLYCSKKCRNASRYMPAAILKKVMARNSRWVVKSIKDPVHIIDGHRFSGYNAEGSTKDNPLGRDEGLLIARARELAESRGIKVPTGTSLQEIEEKKKLMTDNLADDKLKDITKDNLKFINLEDPIKDAGGFGIKGPNNLKYGDLPPKAMVYELKKISETYSDPEMADFKLPDVPGTEIVEHEAQANGNNGQPVQQKTGIRKLSDV